MTDWIAICHLIALVKLSHMCVIDFDSGWLKCICVFITEVSFFWWFVHVNQNVNCLFVLPYQCSQFSRGSSSNVIPLQSQCSTSEVRWYVFTVWSYSSTAISFPVVRSSNRAREDIVHEQFMPSYLHPPGKISNSYMCCCHFLCVFTKINSHVIHVASCTTEFVNFDPKLFMFIWEF